MKYPIAYNVLLENKQLLIDSTLLFISEQIEKRSKSFEHFSNNEKNLDFCKRDLAFVIEAYIDGCLGGDSKQIDFIMSRYWRGNQSVLVGDRNKEVDAHIFLKNNLINLLERTQAESSAIEKISADVDKLIFTIKHGAHTNNLDDVLSKRFTCKHWTDREVPDYMSEYIADCAYLAPSKLGCREFKTVLITNSKRGREIKNWLYYGHTYHSKGDQGKKYEVEPVGFNGQYLAPLLVAWLNPTTPPEKKVITYGDMPTETNIPAYGERKNDIFISAMCAMLAAEEQGLNTGFGSCHDHTEVAKMMGFEGYDCPIMVGVGYAKDMSELEKTHGVLIPVYDPLDPSVQIGYDASNLPQGHTGCVNRNNRPSKESVTVTI